jgi:DNA polymerase (family 10)
MAAAAKALGYEYLAITDHSKALAMTNGLSVERLIKHIENVHRISGKLKGITLLAGSEVDILADGRLDYEDDVLKQLDIVVASPHMSLKQDAKKATDRLVRAIEFDLIPYGISVARRAWLTPKNVLNCQQLADVRKFIKAKRDR